MRLCMRIKLSLLRISTSAGVAVSDNRKNAYVSEPSRFSGALLSPCYPSVVSTVEIIGVFFALESIKRYIVHKLSSIKCCLITSQRRKIVIRIKSLVNSI